MLTFEEERLRIDSLNKMTMTILRKRKTIMQQATDLLAMTNNLPQKLWGYKLTRLDKLLDDRGALDDLYEKLQKATEKLRAKPHISDFCGNEFVVEGMLPDGKPTSTDEAEALKMLEDYYARETA